MNTKSFNTWFKVRYDAFYHSIGGQVNIANEEIKQLIRKINRWNNEYYVLSRPSITDSQYDATSKLLIRWEKKYPQFYLKTSPSQRLNVPVERFSQLMHPQKMLSIENAFSETEVRLFLKRCKKVIGNTSSNEPSKIDYILEPKIDGVSIELHYYKQLLQAAVTRGDGTSGQNIIDNFFDISQLPKMINWNKRIVIRGELYIESSIIKLYEHGLCNKQTILSQRNIVSGLIQKQKRDKKYSYLYFYNKYLKSNIKFWPYFIVETEELKIKNQSDIYAFLAKIGFARPINHLVTDNFPTITKYYEQLYHDGRSFMMDGIVIKVNRLASHKIFGVGTKFSKAMIAWKFTEVVTHSVINSYQVTVGRTGKITYVANIEPVLIDNTIVSRVMMNNFYNIHHSSYFVNSHITIKKAGGIIPKIIAVDNFKITNLQPISKALTCPSCEWILFDDIKGNTLNSQSKTYIQKCLNWNCHGIKVEKIIYFCSREGMNIKNISRAIIKKLFQQKQIANILDLYIIAENLKSLAKSLNSLPIARNIISELNKSRQTSSLITVLQSLGVTMIGGQTWTVLLRAFGTLEELFMASRSQLELLFNKSFAKTPFQPFFSKKAQLIFDWLQSAGNIKFLKSILALFPNISHHKSLANSSILTSHNIAISGKIKNISRRELIQLIQRHGGNYVSTVTPSTKWLISEGNIKGEKFVTANKFKIPILSTNSFLANVKDKLAKSKKSNRS